MEKTVEKLLKKSEFINKAVENNFVRKIFPDPFENIITEKPPFVKGVSKFPGFRSAVHVDSLGGGRLADLGALAAL